VAGGSDRHRHSNTTVSLLAPLPENPTPGSAAADLVYLAKSKGAPQEFLISIHDPETDVWTSREILERGTWHSAMCSVLREWVERLRAERNGALITVLDIGANIGYVSMWVAGLGEDVKVISVEVRSNFCFDHPRPRTHTTLLFASRIHSTIRSSPKP